MRLAAVERRWRDALFAALIPARHPDTPALGDLDLEAFWARFDAAAPAHLALAMRASGLLVGSVLPRLHGHGRSLAELDADARDDVLRRASTTPLVSRLLEVAKIVACLAYFADPDVEAAVRGRR